MRKAFYQGVGVPELVGKSALVRPDSEAGCVLAQFDDAGPEWDCGWHPFHGADFCYPPDAPGTSSKLGVEDVI